MIKCYRKGRRKEQELVREARANGLIAFRSAASKSCIDVATIDVRNRVIELIQSKPNTFSGLQKDKLEWQFRALNGTYEVRYVVK